LILVDTHVLLDIATNDPNWADWSVAQLDAAAVRGPVVINALVYSEFSVGYDQIEDVERLLKDVDIGWAETPAKLCFSQARPFSNTVDKARAEPASCLTFSSVRMRQCRA
jgi:predicted nucleic acid-binding protein